MSETITFSIAEHHPSCKVTDIALTWHCSQCGSYRSAEDVLEAKDKRIKELEAQVEKMRKALEGIKDHGCICMDVELTAKEALKEAGK